MRTEYVQYLQFTPDNESVRPAVVPSDVNSIVRGRAGMVLGSEMVVAGAAPPHSRAVVLLMSSPMRSCSSSPWSRLPSRLRSLSQMLREGKMLI